MSRNVKAFQATLSKTYEWIDAVSTAYAFEDENEAFVVLRATLKSLRDRILADEAYQLGCQLPALLRGFYFEGWNPHRASTKEKSAEDFLRSVRRQIVSHEDVDLAEAVPAILKVIFDKIDRGESEEVIQSLPKEIQELCQ